MRNIVVIMLIMVSLVSAKDINVVSTSNVIMISQTKDKSIIYNFSDKEFELVYRYVELFGQDEFNRLVKLGDKDKNVFLSKLRISVDSSNYLAKHKKSIDSN
jgi:hypothetical protein